MTEAVGLLLLEAGRISREQLLAALESQRRHGGTLGAGLIRVGAIDEEQLTEFLRQRWGVRRVGMAELAAVKPTVLEIVPLDMVQAFRLMPMAVHDEDGIKSLTVVMTDPSDMHAVEEISFFTGYTVERALASESAMAWALERHYDIISPPLLVVGSANRMPEGIPAPLAGTAPSPVASVVSFTAAPPDADELAHYEEGDTVPGERASRPDDELAGLFEAGPGEGDTDPAAIPLTQRKPADEPEHAPNGHYPGAAMQRPSGLPESSSTPFFLPPPLATTRTVTVGQTTPARHLDVAGSLSKIATAHSREGIDAALLDGLAAVGPRVALFVIKKGIAGGWDVRGAFDRNKVREICITLDSPSVLRDVVRTQAPYKGPLKGSTTNVLLSRWLGGIQGEVLLVPVTIGKKVAAVIVADGLDSAAEAVAYTLATAAGQAYQRLILTQRQK
jgi:hypothetical protein